MRGNIKYEKNASCMTADDVREQLPKVGDKLIRRMSVGDTAFGLGRVEPCECVVTYVNEAHGLYEVQFPCGIRQGYRI